MEILKLKNNLIILLTFLICHSVLAQEGKSKINIESVRQDVIDQDNYMFPQHHIKNFDKSKFNVFYLNDLCLVQIPYKNTDTHSSEKFSHIMVYTLQGKNWVFKTSIPYYYNLKLIDTGKRIFFSDNLFCSMDGNCDRLVEISKFDDANLLSMVKFEGYNNVLYYDRLLVFDEKEEVLNAIGDTICNEFIVSDIEIDEEGLDSYVVKQKVVILKNIVSDTLQTVEKVHYNKRLYKP